MENVTKFVKLLIALTACFFLYIYTDQYISDYRRDYDKELTSTVTAEGEDVEVYIPEGASARKIAKILKNKGLIKYEGAFTKRLKNTDYRGKLGSGTFTLNTGMNTLDMMQIMATKMSEDVETVQLVVPEGFTVDLIGARCEKKGICSKADFVAEVKAAMQAEYGFLDDATIPSDVRYRIEGFMFPATYEIPEGMTVKELVAYMTKTFSSYYKEDYKAKAEERGLTTYQVITLASLLERECKVPEERAIMAGIYYNRMQSGMPLQVDASILYVKTDGMYDTSILKDEDRKRSSGYNTYLNEGLPSGPICNPGTACIEAVLNPADTSYLYYRLDDPEKGTHEFSETPFEGENTGDGDDPSEE